eukprot:SAG31_NODE_13741_length_850_cov_0.938748_1_plen_77_part_10
MVRGVIFSFFCATIREIWDFNCEKYGTNRESVTLQDVRICHFQASTLSFARVAPRWLVLGRPADVQQGGQSRAPDPS